MLNIWIVQRNGLVSASIQSAVYEINKDALTQEKSSFTVSEMLDFKQGDFLMAKFKHGKGIAFFGVIDSHENNKIICNDISSLVNFEFPATRMNGNSFEQHAKNLIDRYLIQDKTKTMDILNIDIKSNTNHMYQPAEPPTATNMTKYLINAFRKYNIVWSVESYSNWRVNTVIEQKTKTIRLKNNIAKFVDWEISTTGVGRNIENQLLIVNKNTTNSEGPNVLSTWYLTTENEVTQDANHPKISKPTKTKVWIYDMTEEDKPVYKDVAESELKGSYYTHEITFKMPIENDLISFDDLILGTLAEIIYDDELYQSVLSGFRLSDESDYIELRFGHIRSRLSEILE